MENKINALFAQKKHEILSIFFTAGFPRLDDTTAIITALEQGGADMIEIGMPYSDPVADGPVIERSDAAAIANGMTLHRLFSQLKSLNLKRDVPVILMGYINPVMQYGYEAFCRDAVSAGISGFILPDLPPEVFLKEMKPFTDKYNLKFIFLITPETSEERICWIDSISDGFIYAVSSSSITGRLADEDKKETYLKRIQSYGLRNPVLVGFGIKDRKTFQQACRYTNGAIIGTAFINAICDKTAFNSMTKDFLMGVKGR